MLMERNLKIKTLSYYTGKKFDEKMNVFLKELGDRLVSIQHSVTLTDSQLLHTAMILYKRKKDTDEGES